MLIKTRVSASSMLKVWLPLSREPFLGLAELLFSILLRPVLSEAQSLAEDLFARISGPVSAVCADATFADGTSHVSYSNWFSPDTTAWQSRCVT